MERLLQSIGGGFMKKSDYEYIRFNYNIVIIVAVGGGIIALIIGMGFLRDFLGIHSFWSTGFSPWWMSLPGAIICSIGGILAILGGISIIFEFYIKKAGAK